MSIFTRIRQTIAGWIAPPEGRTTDPRNPLYWLRMFGLETMSGIEVNERNCYESAAFSAGASQIADAIGLIPFHVIQRRPDGSQRRRPDHPLSTLLLDAPNDWMTSFTWRETSMHHALTTSNAFSRIFRDGSGAVRAFVPIEPRRCSAFFRTDAGAENESPLGSFFPELLYRIDGTDIVAARDMLHVRAQSWNGVAGRSRIETGKESIGLALSADRYAGRFFANGGIPPIAIMHPLELSEAAYARMKKEWSTRYEGLDNAHQPAILEEGAKIERVGVDPEAAQVLGARVQGAREMARLLKIPPHLVGDLEYATFSNIEHQGLQFVIYTLLPWVTRWEQELNLKALTSAERADGFFVEGDLSVFLRGDMKSRYEAYAIARNGGWMSVNDIRRRENEDPVAGGDVYLQPLNMAPAGAPQDTTADDAAAAAADGAGSTDAVPAARGGDHDADLDRRLRRAA